MDWEKVIKELDEAAERAMSEHKRRAGTSLDNGALLGASWVLSNAAEALRKGLE